MSDEFKNVTVQLTPDLLAQIDVKAKRLDLNRSQYFRRLVREDLEREAQAPTLEQPQPHREAA